jgi:outer membrane receptor protein involved in Fe transport
MRFRSAFVLLLCLVVVTSLSAQTTGTLSGVVKQEGNPLPGVTVTIASPNLQGTRETITNEGGGYSFANLPPGEYSVGFALEGLQPLTRRVQVGLAQNARVDAELTFSPLAEAITVTAAVPAVAETTEVQTNFQQDTIEDLPINRNIVAITGLAPGVVAGVNGFQISGGMSFDNLYTVNGAVIQETLRGQPFNLFIEDAIQETTVQTAGVSAEFGNFTGGVVNAITKSGGNEFSGSLRDSLTNPRWTATSPDIYQLQSGAPVRTSAADNLDQLNSVYEATLGGRILRDRLWFFVAGRQTENESERFFSNSASTYVATTTDERFEAKFTGTVTPKHSLVASYMDAPVEQINNCQFGCFDMESVDPYIAFPNDFITAFYNGVITNNLFVEAKFTKMNFEFDSLGGDDADIATGTPIHLAAPGYNTYTNAPPFCGNCTTDLRDNDTVGLKGTYFLGTRGFGNHNIVAGLERYHETRLSDNHQSPSGFRIVSRTRAPKRDASGNTLVSLVPVTGGSLRDYVWWFPIELSSQGSDLTTDALYVNDKWNLNANWSFNLGLRFDRNDSTDSAGVSVADDQKLSPRLGATYDVFANGRLRLNASFGTYVGRLAETVANGQSPAGTPANFAYAYQGPELVDLPPAEVAQRFFEWFNANGGTTRNTVSAYVPGFSQRLSSKLVSPSVDEWTIGASTQIGRGFLRADYIHRDWQDFYVGDISMEIGAVTSPTGQRTDLILVRNGDDLTREYDAVELQGQYRFTNRLNAGANYTWSRTWGNATGENTSFGPFVSISRNYYREYYDFDWFAPEGYLSTDQTHKARAWVSYDFETFLGNFNLSALQRFDSGSPYQLTGAIDIRHSANFYGTGQAGGVADPGYVTAPTSVTYFFSDRGEFRFDDLTATDLALNYSTNRSWLGGAQFFVQGELINAFNEDARTAFNTSVITHLQDPSLKRFNPHAGDVPVEGVHWRKGPLFGLPTAATNAQVAGSYQLPRTYRVSFGVKF